MDNNRVDQVTPLRVRSRRLSPEEPAPPAPAVQWADAAPRRSFGQSLLKNMAVAASLLLCVLTLRTGAIPAADQATDVLLAAATDQSLLDSDLGKLSFVSALFPEAVLVFGESSSATLSMPVSGGTVIHAWSEAEPYMSWRSSTTTVTASADGEVMGVYHGNGDERLVQVLGYDGMTCVYGNLASVAVSTGDQLQAGDVIGALIPGADCVFEVRRDGMSIDPALYLGR